MYAWTAVVRGAVIRGLEGEMIISRKARMHYVCYSFMSGTLLIKCRERVMPLYSILQSTISKTDTGRHSGRDGWYLIGMFLRSVVLANRPSMQWHIAKGTEVVR
jgi:hypothetical protein